MIGMMSTIADLEDLSHTELGQGKDFAAIASLCTLGWSSPTSQQQKNHNRFQYVVIPPQY